MRPRQYAGTIKRLSHRRTISPYFGLRTRERAFSKASCSLSFLAFKETVVRVPDGSNCRVTLITLLCIIVFTVRPLFRTFSSTMLELRIGQTMDSAPPLFEAPNQVQFREFCCTTTKGVVLTKSEDRAPCRTPHSVFAVHGSMLIDVPCLSFLSHEMF